MRKEIREAVKEQEEERDSGKNKKGFDGERKERRE